MRTTKTIQVVACHAEGEVGDVVVGGVEPPPGATLWEQRNFIATDETLRNFLLNEPRGGVFRHFNLLVPPKNPKAQMGFIIMEPCDTPPMSGSNSICVATVLLDHGILPMEEPVTQLVLEAPGGLVQVRAQCANGKAEKITITNVPSFVDQQDVFLEVEGVGTLQVDTVYGGDSFVMVDAETLGLNLQPEEAKRIAELGVAITDAANEQLGFHHPTNPEWDHISFCQFMGSLDRIENGWTGPNAVTIKPGKIDRCPTGTGCSARMALLHARGQMKIGEMYLAKSIIGSQFECRIEGTTELGSKPAIIPSITGRAWITGKHEYLLDPDDPWPAGYRVADTWPMGKQ